MKRKKTMQLTETGTGEETKDNALTTPTSISMQNSFIIKNADDTFDAYYHQMKKRKFAAGHAGLDGTMSATMP